MSSNTQCGDLGEVRHQDNVVSLRPSSAALRFIVVFGCLFLPTFVIVAWFFIDGPDKWIPIAMGPVCGVIAFGFIFWIVKSNIDKGPYIEFDAATNIVSVPRLDVEFERSEVEYLQLITGRSTTLPDVQMDLNLVINEGGRSFRYLIMPSPHRPYVLEFAKLADLEVREVKLGRKGCRDDSLGSLAIDG